MNLEAPSGEYATSLTGNGVDEGVVTGTALGAVAKDIVGRTARFSSPEETKS